AASSSPSRKPRKTKKKRKKKSSTSSSSSSSSSSASKPPPAWPGYWPPVAMPYAWPGYGWPGYSWPPPGPHPGAMPPATSGGRREPSRSRSSRSPEPEKEKEKEDVAIFLDTGVEDTVAVPKSFIARVIGKKGATIAEVRAKSGAWKVDARDQSTDPCQVKLQGTPEAVKKARELILELLKPLREKHSESEFVDISQGQIGKVIGLKGARVHELEAQTGAKIDIDYNREPCRVYLTGNPDNVQTAKQLLTSIANDTLGA
ncbi:FUBP1, partial [Symbiodinium sp. KB8]